jgi:aspartate aminotransferase
MTHPLKLASRLDPIKPSITLAVTAKAAKLKADGIDVVSFGAGEPDFDTPAHIKDAARKALDGGTVGKYTEVGGVVALRKAALAKIRQKR